MSQVHVTSNASKKWIVIAGAAIAVVGAAAYWFTGSGDVDGESRVSDASAVPSTAPTPSVPTTEYSNPNPTPQQAQAALEEQKVAAKVIEQQPDMKPLTGPITERPSFVSPMEWAMLQGVVQQHANPDKELTRMVNFLRFMKQMETLEATPQTAENKGKRQLLTAQLIEDLPNRVLGGDLDLPDAQSRMGQWLPEALPDETKRKQKAEVINKKLVEASEAYKKAQAAADAATAKQP